MVKWQRLVLRRGADGDWARGRWTGDYGANWPRKPFLSACLILAAGLALSTGLGVGQALAAQEPTVPGDNGNVGGQPGSIQVPDSVAPTPSAETPEPSPISAPRPEPSRTATALGQAMFSGRIDASLGFVAPDSAHPDEAWTVLGQSSGRISLGSNGTAVKPELRASFTTWPNPTLQLDRAWVKFRFPGVRATLGLGKLGWGPGLVLVPGDLLFDSTSPGASLGADEIRGGATWLGDLWVSLGSESYVEGMLLTPDPRTVSLGSAGTTNGGQATVASLPLPDSVSHLAGGLRTVLVLGELGLELAWAVDGVAERHLAAVSTQFHLGLDWYLTARKAFPFAPAADWAPISGLDLGAGAFGNWDLGEGFGLSSRHEILVRPNENWQKVEATATPASTTPMANAAVESKPALLAYHDLSLAMPEHLSLTGRVLWSPVEPSSLISGELAWNPLQALRLSLFAAGKLGIQGATWNGERAGAFSLGLGASTTW